MTQPVRFDFKTYLKEKKEQVDTALALYLPEVADLTSDLMKSMRYSVFAGGKRLRPILCLAGANTVGALESNVMPAACALEMIHTYSLIHDDLPAMDDDNYRRGKPTNHKVFGEGVAILAGDLLLTYAFELMASAAPSVENPTMLLNVMRIIAEAAGFRGMIGGQMIDLECENRKVDLSTVEEMHRKKTGALLTASVKVGALLGGADGDELKRFEDYGYHFGLAFQITDDLLDIVGNFKEMGKKPGSDLEKNKMTYPALLGVDGSREAAEMHVKKAVEAISPYGDTAEPLKAIAEYLLQRRG